MKTAPATQEWTKWPDEQFLSYVTSHSRTPRHLFAIEMIEHLHTLAGQPINRDLYTIEKMGQKEFAQLEATLADALVRAVRIRMDDTR